MTRPQAPRTKRANGVESRLRILDAAVEIAADRRYEGTSIAAVSARCGLPASSIFETWLTEVELQGGRRAHRWSRSR